MSTQLTPFHVALQVRDLAEARGFYGGVLGLPEGRSDVQWVDYNLFGHQLVCHENPELGKDGQLDSYTNPVDGHAVPLPHCGVILEMADWQSLADKLRGHAINFVIEPYIRFKGEPGEQATMFFLDPTGNALEFKSFNDVENQLFAM